MEITPQLIKELREQTGIAMMTCKEADSITFTYINKDFTSLI